MPIISFIRLFNWFIRFAQPGLEVANAFAEIAHNFWQLARTEKHQHDDQQQNNMCEA